MKTSRTLKARAMVYSLIHGMHATKALRLSLISMNRASCFSLTTPVVGCLPANISRALTYLELQRMLLLMYTSCGWFFNDISGMKRYRFSGMRHGALDLMTELGCRRLVRAS
jgi:hypothetical protein